MKFRKIETGFIDTDMSHMIGLVFLLFMFLIVAMNFENTKAEEQAKLSRDMLAKPPEVRAEYELALTFSYQRDRNGSKAAPYPTVFYNGRHVEVDQLGTALQQEKRTMEALHGRGVIEKTTVLIRAESRIPMGLVQQLIRKCQDNGFSKFSLQAAVDE